MKRYPKPKGLRELALFAGGGGGILGGQLLGWTPVCAVEKSTYPREVLLSRQLDGSLPQFPIWDDVTTFDGNQWRGSVDVVSGGFPCVDLSTAGKRRGIVDGSQSSLWDHMARIIGEVQPYYCLVENSPMLVHTGQISVVLGDLSELGYNANWGIIGAHQVGANHHRKRVWILAWSRTQEPPTESAPRVMPHGLPKWWETEPDTPRLTAGEPFQAQRLAALGNGQVPAVVQTAWNTLRKS